MTLPNIIQCETSTDESAVARVSLLLDITSDLPAFEGHFRNRPILPGVVQIEWAIAFAGEHFGHICATQVSHIEVLKFQNVIQPDAQVSLDIHRANNKIVFAYHTAGVQHSSGKIVVSEPSTPE